MDPLKQPTSVDQSDRVVPINLRQSGDPGIEMLIYTRIRKGPFWHLSAKHGCWRASVYNRMYHPRNYVRPEDGGAAVEHEALIRDVTLWNATVSRQIQVLGPDAEAFVNFVITRDATRIKPMNARYVILCNQKGGIVQDPILHRISENEFWFSLSDGDLLYWLQGINVGIKYKIDINETDVGMVQVQGPKSEALLADLVGTTVRDVPFYGLMRAQIAGRDVIVSQTGWSGEKGYEIYLFESTLYADDLWSAVNEAGEKYDLTVVGAFHQRRIHAGILSWGQDMDNETYPFQCNLGYQVPPNKEADYIGKRALDDIRARLEAGNPPFQLILVGLHLGGNPIDDYAPDFWLISDADGGEPIGYVTSPWWSPELHTNIAMGYVPVSKSPLGTKLKVWLPDAYASVPGEPDEADVVEMPFRPSAHPSARERAKAAGRDHAY